jgi:hypothetical protein
LLAGSIVTLRRLDHFRDLAKRVIYADTQGFTRFYSSSNSHYKIFPFSEYAYYSLVF